MAKKEAKEKVVMDSRVRFPMTGTGKSKYISKGKSVKPTATIAAKFNAEGTATFDKKEDEETVAQIVEGINVPEPKKEEAKPEPKKGNAK